MSTVTRPLELRRRGVRWPVLLSLTVVWVLLWGSLTLDMVLTGLVVSLVVVIVFPLPPIVFGGKVHPWPLCRLIARFFADLFVASVQVSWTVLRFKYQPTSAVIEVDLYSRSDLYLTLTAELLSLVPGSLVVEARRSTSTLFLHILDVSTDEEIELARTGALEQEQRVVYALASPDELAAYEEERRREHA